MQEGAYNLRQLTNERINGYEFVKEALEEREGQVRVILITEKDVEIFKFNPDNQEWFSNTEPQILAPPVQDASAAEIP